MPINTADLGRPGNLEKLNFLVGKIAGKEVSFIAGNCFFKNILDEIPGLPKGRSRYHPVTNAHQCLEATPRMDISCAQGNKFVVSHERMEFENPVTHESELIARCLALVFSVHGDEVPDSAWEGL